jgi:hypothetical protein
VNHLLGNRLFFLIGCPEYVSEGKREGESIRGSGNSPQIVWWLTVHSLHANCVIDVLASQAESCGVPISPTSLHVC